MGVYEDGSRDCPACLADGVSTPNRVRGDNPALLCFQHERIVHNDAMAGFAQMAPWMRKHLAFTDFLIEHGRHTA